MRRHTIVILTVLLFAGLVLGGVNKQVTRTIVDDLNPNRGGAVDLLTIACSIYDDPDTTRPTRTVTEGPDVFDELCRDFGAVVRSPTRDCVESGAQCAIAGAVYCADHGDLLSALMNPDGDVRYNACAVTCTDGSTATSDRCQPDPNLACLLPGEQGPCEETDMSAGTGRPNPKQNAREN